jgi:pimeloyl-ACP methyl ester carboxylesterase
MHTELITFRTPDGVALDGAWHRPEAGARAGTAVLLVHGKARNFYTGPSRYLAPHIVARGFTALAINRRGHDVIYAQPGHREAGGAAFEVFADSQQDVLGAVNWLAAQGYPQVALVGHSFGGVVSTVFTAAHADRVPALVLCSAAAGGPGYLDLVCRQGWLAGGGLPALLDRARELRGAGQGEELLLAPKWWWAISARSALELNVPDLAEAAGRTHCPILAIRGSLEPVDAYPIERVRDAAAGRAATAIVEGGDHYYTGHEDAAGILVADWLAKTL